MSQTEELETFLNEPHVAVLTTVDRKGRPHGAPVWYLYEDGEFIVSTDQSSQKARNIGANPEICLVIDRRTVPYFAAMVHGRAEIGPKLSDADRLRLAVRYLGEKLGKAYVSSMPDPNGITIRLRPRKIIQYSGRAGRATS